MNIIWAVLATWAVVKKTWIGIFMEKQIRGFLLWLVRTKMLKHKNYKNSNFFFKAYFLSSKYAQNHFLVWV